jgi:hypothetical protein
MTNDSHLFHKQEEKPKDSLPLYEGKMIHQFNPGYNTGRFWISESEAQSDLLGKEIFRIRQETGLETKEIAKIFTENNFLLDYQTYRLAYRAVGSSTNERTLICTLLPSNVFIGHSMNYLVNFTYKGEDKSFVQLKLSKTDIILIMALFNSLTLNYYIRNKISVNLTMNFIYELPIPQIEEKQKTKIVNKSFNLLCHNSNPKLFDDLSEELGITPENNIDVIRTRAEIEVLIGKELYKLTKEEWEYLTSTFIYGDESDSKKELDEIIAYSRKLF